jgi:hypothetical protein
MHSWSDADQGVRPRAERDVLELASEGGIVVWPAPACLLIPLADRGPGLALFVLGSVTVVSAIIAGNVIWGGWLQSYYPGKLLGRVSTSLQVFNYGSIPLGAIVAGALASHLGVRAALWIMLSGLVLSVLVLLTSPLRHLRDLHSREANVEAQAGQDSTELPAPKSLINMRRAKA